MIASMVRCGRRPQGPSVQGRSAFTLVEILVVAAIISLLVAILIPSLAAARRHARKTTCLSNVHQITAAWSAYLADSKDRFLKGTNKQFTYGGRQGALTAYRGRRPLNRYVGAPPKAFSGADVFWCPDDPGARNITGTCFTWYGNSYHMNQFLVGPTDFKVYDHDPLKPVMNVLRERTDELRRSQVFDDGRLILLGEADWWDTWHFHDQDRINWHGTRSKAVLGYLAGHARFTLLRKGLPVTSDYSLIPFRDLAAETVKLQPPVSDSTDPPGAT